MITTFIRKKIEDNKLYGFVIKESDELLLMAKQYDFQFDGYKVVRKKDITHREISDSNRYCAKLMRREKAWVKVPTWVRGLDLDSWPSLLRCIKTKVVILHNETIDGGFYIGPVLSLGSKKVELGWFDGEGNWGSPDTIQYSKITACDFLDRYSTIHSKYLKWC